MRLGVEGHLHVDVPLSLAFKQGVVLQSHPAHNHSQRVDIHARDSRTIPWQQLYAIYQHTAFDTLSYFS
jgi:hypothetical protein